MLRPDSPFRQVSIYAWQSVTALTYFHESTDQLFDAQLCASMHLCTAYAVGRIQDLSDTEGAHENERMHGS